LKDDNSIVDIPGLYMTPTPPPVLPVFRATWWHSYPVRTISLMQNVINIAMKPRLYYE